MLMANLFEIKKNLIQEKKTLKKNAKTKINDS
jgi:hypothetical protein